MNRIFTLFTIAFLLSSAWCGGQQKQSPLEFDHIGWNFGSAKEDGGSLTHEYPFKNIGRDSVRITEVATYCRCTKASFPRHALAPGEKASIRVTFDPFGYSGSVSRSVSVMTDAGSKDRLEFTTELTPRVKPVEEEYPVLLPPGLRVEKTELDLNILRQGGTGAATLRVANVSDHALSLSLSVTPSERSSVMSSDRRESRHLLSPGQKADIPIKCPPAQTVGIFADTLILTIDHDSFLRSLFSRQTQIPIVIKSTVTESFGSLPEGTSGASANITSTYTNFGKIPAGAAPVTKQYTLANRGDMPLIVCDVSCPDGITAMLPVGTTVEPGCSIGFTVTLDPASFPQGPVFTTMRILLNDPLKPVRDLMIAARII